MKHSKVVVFGANGFLGLNLCYWLVENNYEVDAVGRQEEFKGKELFKEGEVNYYQADISVKANLASLDLSQYKSIFIFAGQTGTIDGFQNYESYVASNEIGLLNILDIYVSQEASGRLVFPSSRLVYKGIKGTRLTEDSAKETKTVYAVNKLACENYLYAYSLIHKISFTIFRICVPYGQLIPGDYSYGTLGFMLNQVKTKKSINLYGKGEPARTFTHVRDLCQLIGNLSFLPQAKGKTLNIGSEDNYDLLTLASRIADKFHAEVSFSPWPQNALAIESGDTMFCDDALQEIYPYKYQENVNAFIEKLSL